MVTDKGMCILECLSPRMLRDVTYYMIDYKKEKGKACGFFWRRPITHTEKGGEAVLLQMCYGVLKRQRQDASIKSRGYTILADGQPALQITYTGTLEVIVSKDLKKAKL